MTTPAWMSTKGIASGALWFKALGLLFLSGCLGALLPAAIFAESERASIALGEEFKLRRESEPIFNPEPEKENENADQTRK